MRTLRDGLCAACRGRLQRLQKMASSRFSSVQYAHVFIVSRLCLFRSANTIFNFSMTLKIAKNTLLTQFFLQYFTWALTIHLLWHTTY